MSKEGNIRKNVALVEPYGTATNKLKKAIMFSLVQETEKDICFQCGKKIEDINNFSVEHKKPWLNSETPIELFYSLDNIAFSHLSCNCKANSNIPPIMYGENSPAAKLTLENVKNIKETLKTESCLAKIARQYGVEYKAIRKIRDNKTWVNNE